MLLFRLKPLNRVRVAEKFLLAKPTALLPAYAFNFSFRLHSYSIFETPTQGVCVLIVSKR